MDYTVLGPTATAAKLVQESAVPGQIVADGATFEQIKELFDLRPLKPVGIDGESEPILAYEVLTARPNVQ